MGRKKNVDKIKEEYQTPVASSDEELFEEIDDEVFKEGFDPNSTELEEETREALEIADKEAQTREKIEGIVAIWLDISNHNPPMSGEEELKTTTEMVKWKEIAKYRETYSKNHNREFPTDDEIKKQFKLKNSEYNKILKAREKMINSNLRLVIGIAKKNQNKGLSFEDLISAGNSGLIKAVDRYDVNLRAEGVAVQDAKPFKFSTYATWWIRQTITIAVQNHGRLVHIPVHIRDLISQIKLAMAKISQETNVRPTIEELAAYLTKISKKPVTVANIQRAMSFDFTISSLDEQLGEDSDLSRGEIITDNRFPTPASHAKNEELKEKFYEILSTNNDFTAREKKIMIQYFGIGLAEKVSIVEIAEQAKITQERVRQIINGVIKKLKNPKYANQLKQFLN